MQVKNDKRSDIGTCVSFVLPFALPIGNKQEFIVNSDGEKIGCIIENLHDKRRILIACKDSSYESVINSSSVEISSSSHKDYESEISHDEAFRVFTYASVTLYFPYTISLDQPSASQAQEGIRKQALKFVNRIVETIRYHTKDVYIRPVMEGEVEELHVSYVENGEQLQSCLLMMPGSMSLSIEDNVISPAILSRIYEDLKANKSLDLDTSLLLNAQALYLSGSNGLCLIQAVTALEIAVTRFITWCFQGARTSDKILEVMISVFKKYFGRDYVRDNIKKCRLDILMKPLKLMESMERLQDLLLSMHIFRSRSTNLPEIIESCCGAIEARNKVAHQHWREISSDKTSNKTYDWLDDIGKLISLTKKICDQKEKSFEEIWEEESTLIHFNNSGELNIAPIAGIISLPYRKSIQY